MLNSISSTRTINFKSNESELSNNGAYTSSVSSSKPDVVEISTAKKKQKNNEKWAKVSIIAQVVLAIGCLSMVGLALCPNLINKITSRGSVKKLQKEFVDLSKDKGIVDIDDPSLAKSFQEWAKEIVDGAKTPKVINDFIGNESTPNMVFMSGGSGVGKTYNADVLLKALGAQRIKRQFSNYSSKYIGETSVNLTKFFDDFDKILEKNPNKKYGMVLDEFETLAHNIEELSSKDNHLKENRTAILNGLDKIRKRPNVYIVATSNVPLESGSIDKAIARRFGKNIEIEYPNKEALKSSLKIQLDNQMKNKKLVKNDNFDLFKDENGELNVFLENLVDRKGGHGDVENIVREAINKLRIDINNTAIQLGYLDKNGNILNKPALDKYLEGQSFKVKYLQEALDKIGKLAGEVK